ncbi:MAG: hypothetical protein AAF806_08215 [Bacteroidota bacterium]
MLVELDEGLRQLLVHLLQEDYQIMTTETIMESWRYLFSGECLPNLLIIDLDTAAPKSKELVEQMKANGILKEIPIIALCTKQKTSVATSPKVDKTFFKPFDPNDLKEKIVELIT